MRKLGQHFLTNKNKIKKIVDALELKADDTIIEIGPGHGELTLELRIKNAELRIITIEKDEKLVQILQKKFAPDKNIKIIEGDALKILKPYTLHLKSYKITGNIPYYITGYFFRILGELKNKSSLIILTIQKEVAERIVSKPPQMNLLAASVQFWAEPKIVDYISKKDFKPQPKVDSAIIRLAPARNYADKHAEFRGKYYKFIKILFKQPRKTILNNLRDAKNANTSECREKLLKIGVNPYNRPQNLSVEQIIKLSTLF